MRCRASADAAPGLCPPSSHSSQPSEAGRVVVRASSRCSRAGHFTLRKPRPIASTSTGNKAPDGERKLSPRLRSDADALRRAREPATSDFFTVSEGKSVPAGLLQRPVPPLLEQGAPIKEARLRIAWAASTGCEAQTQATPGLRIPAFSKAMAARVSPR